MDQPSGPESGSESERTQSGMQGPRTPSLPLPPSKQVPSDFGDYQSFELLGKGAFGVVFKVWSKSKSCYEAMKILDRADFLEGKRLEAFKVEVQNMARAAGTYVAHVHHVGALPDGRPFFTMEYVDGGRLDRYCDQAQVSIDDRIQLMAKVCDGVQRLHNAKFVHCDLKPGNILVMEEDDIPFPKLVDFGLARQREFSTSPGGLAAGTLPYMSPEQLENPSGKPKQSWDVYALGVTLYEILVGDCPIELSDPFGSFEDVAKQVRKTPVPLLRDKLSSSGDVRSGEIAEERQLSVDELRHRLENPWLEGIVRKALAKNQKDRISSAAELADNLRAFVSGRRPPVVSPTWRNRVTELVLGHRIAFAALVILIVAALVSVHVIRTGRAAKRAMVDAIFSEGCSEIEPQTAIRTFQHGLELDAHRNDIRLHLAAAYLSLGDAPSALRIAGEIRENDAYYDEAAAFIRGVHQLRSSPGVQGIDVDPKLPVSPREEYYYALALGPNQAGLAVDLLTRALQSGALTYEERFHLRLLRAIRYFQLRDFKALDEETQWLVAEARTSAAAWNLRGIFCCNTGRLGEAQAAYDKALQINPGYSAVIRNRADLQVLLGHHREALEDCARAVKIDPTMASHVQGTRIRALLGVKDMSGATAECEKVRDGPEFTLQTHLACGYVWAAAQRSQRAWEEFDRAVRLTEGDESRLSDSRYEALQMRGELASICNRQSDAIEDLNAAERLQPEKWRSAPRNYNVRGIVYLLSGQTENAISDLEKSASATKAVVDYLWIWDALLSLGRTQEAASALERAKSAAEKDPWLGRIVAFCGGEMSRDALLAAAGNSFARRIEAYYYMGLGAKAHGDVRQAEEDFNSCLAEPDRQIESDLAVMQLARLKTNPSIRR